jgi:hypothetical protein
VPHLEQECKPCKTLCFMCKLCDTALLDGDKCCLFTTVQVSLHGYHIRSLTIFRATFDSPIILSQPDSQPTLIVLAGLIFLL